MRDLNTLIAPGSGLQLTNAFNINDRSEILTKSFPVDTTPNDDADLGHLLLLVPCGDEDHEGDCADHDRSDTAVMALGSKSPSTPATARTPHQRPSTMTEASVTGWAKWAHQFRIPNAPKK